MSIEDLMRVRSAAEYADFVVPLVAPHDRLIDVGCGAGSITLGLALLAGHVTGVDLDGGDFADALEYAAAQGIRNIAFRQGSIYELDFADASFDVCTLFSMLETVEDPLAGLAEVRRVVRPGGLVAASSIEYGGLILHGPHGALLQRFYELRLAIWAAQGDVWIRRGRELRGLFLASGFEDVEASISTFSYGTAERVRSFGLDRAADCRDDWYRQGVADLGLAAVDELDEIEQAWTRWSESPEAFAAFAWGRVLARCP